jgi:undecaprenyl-diphosphatase
MTGSPWLTNLIAWLSGAPGWLAAALFATAFVESLAIAGILVPGVAILFAVAALAGKTGMPLSEALVWAGLGAVAGDTLSFALGRLLQGRLTSVWPLSRYPTLIAKGERFFHRHGGKSVVIGRFVGPVRPVIPLVAGALRMPWRRFLAFNISSAVAWAPVYVVPGFMVGSALDSGLRPPAHFYAVIGISLAGLGVVYFILSRIQLGLGEGSRVYRWFEQRMARYGAGHRFWRLYTNDRPARAGEFPLASLLLAATASGLFLIWGQLAVNGILDEFNQAVLSWFQQLRQPLLDGPAIAFTLLGDPPVLVCAAGLAILVLAFRGYYAAAVHILLATLLTLGLVSLLKSTLGVARPDLVFQPPTSGAFPSGHVAGITVFTTLLAAFIAAETRHRRRWQTYVALSLPLVPVAVSRLYLGVHWFTDVAGGVLLGLAITGLVRASFSRYDRVPLSVDSLTWLAFLLWLTFTTAYLHQQWPDARAAYSLTPAGKVIPLPES